MNAPVKLLTLDPPTDADVLHVVMRLCEDQIRESIAQGWADTFDLERVASGVCKLPGIKHVFRDADGEPYCIAGYVPILPAVCESWMLATPKWTEHVFEVTRTSRRVMKHILDNTPFKRLQTLSLASRTHAHAWYATIGLRPEGTLRKMGRAGEDFVMFARVQEEG